LQFRRARSRRRFANEHEVTLLAVVRRAGGDRGGGDVLALGISASGGEMMTESDKACVDVYNAWRDVEVVEKSKISDRRQAIADAKVRLELAVQLAAAQGRKVLMEL
jgi:hypothetical protein